MTPPLHHRPRPARDAGPPTSCRNGHPPGAPSFLCRACGRRFVQSPRKGPVPRATRTLVLRLLGERMALRAIARVTGLSRSWLQRFVNALYRERDAPRARPAPKKRATS